MTLYHSTPEENLASIRERGILRGGGTRSCAMVFLSRDPQSWRRPGDGQVTLRVDASGLEGRFSEPVEGLDEVVFFGDVPPSLVGAEVDPFQAQPGQAWVEAGGPFRRRLEAHGWRPVRGVFVFPDEEAAELALAEADADVRREFLNEEALARPGAEGEPEGVSRASSLVSQLVDLYDEEGFRELTPGLSRELDRAVETLGRNSGWKRWVANMHALAVDVRDRFPEIEIRRSAPGAI